MSKTIRVAVDSLVATSTPAIPTRVPTADLSFQVFDSFDPPHRITNTLREIQPDVVMVDSAWLVAASLLESLVVRSGFPKARRVVGVRVADDVLKIQAAHRGMFDVVNLSSSPVEFAARIQSIHRGTSSLANDDLWLRVPRPNKVADITTVPQDETDLAIIELICIGYRDQDIAEAIHYSVQSVKNRLGNMMKRSGVSNRTQLAWQFTNQLLTARMIQNMEQHERLNHAVPERSTEREQPQRSADRA